MIRITTVYDQADKLVQLKFIKNRNISLAVLKVIGLVVEFQTKLSNVIINKGLSRAGIRELSKWLALTNITDLCLDNLVINDGNYELTLEKGCLKSLSLSRSKIDDDILKKMVSRLVYPLPASKTLAILKLSSNRITDEGAKHIAEMLRTNRQLAYLNLSDNTITDDGFIAILDVLQEFPLRDDEILAAKSRYASYIKEKNKIIDELMKDVLAGNFERMSLKNAKNLKKNSKSASKTTNLSARKNKTKKSCIINDMISHSSAGSWEDKVKTVADNKIGKLTDSFSKENIHHKDGQVFCHGNNILAYINLSYNNISYISVKRLWNLLLNQKIFDRKPRGLVNVPIDGNFLPANCIEMENIYKLLSESIEVSSGKQAQRKSRIVKSESFVNVH